MSSRRRDLTYVTAALAWLAFASQQGCDCGGGYPTHPPSMQNNRPDGSVSVNGGFNVCPVASVMASPESARLGEAVALQAHADDPDRGKLSFEWKASAGAVTKTDALETTYPCTEPGPITITFTVTDGTCTVMQSASIFCVAGRDGGAGQTGTGSGGGGGTGVATGSGGSGAGGTTGAGGSPVVNSCPGAEPTAGSAACAGCTTDNCSLGAAGTDGCCGLPSAADQLLCQAAFACFAAHASTCTTAGDPTACFCGASLAAGTCFSVAGAASGPCAAQVIAAAKSPTPSTIKSLFVSPASPLGRAVNLSSCRGSFCTAECAIP